MAVRALGYGGGNFLRTEISLKKRVRSRKERVKLHTTGYYLLKMSPRTRWIGIKIELHTRSISELLRLKQVKEFNWPQPINLDR
jgi:hypothetical protein